MKRFVIKVGTDVLVSRTTGRLDGTNASIIASQIYTIVRGGNEVALVSSGAIKAGKDSMTAMGKCPNLSKKEWAGIGARHLLNIWGDAFAIHGIEVAQIWVTFANWSLKKEYLSIMSAASSYMSNCLVPIFNENDVVSDDEIVLMDQGISENDRLARMVADMIDANAVLFLTSVGGVYDTDPAVHASAKRLDVIRSDMSEVIPRSIAKSFNGSGGIDTKILEAFECSKRGRRVAIAGIMEENVIERFAAGQRVGTTVEA
jgi:glutamate 5-kinase